MAALATASDPPALKAPPKAPSVRKLPAGVGLYPKAVKQPQSMDTSGDGHYEVLSAVVEAPLDQVVLYYKKHLKDDPPQKTVKKGQYRIFEGWFKAAPVEGYYYRLRLISPTMDPRHRRSNPRLTRIEFYMDYN